MSKLIVFLNLRNSPSPNNLFIVDVAGHAEGGRLKDIRLQGCCTFIIDELGNVIKRPSGGIFPAVPRLNSKQMTAIKKAAMKIEIEDLRKLLPDVFIPRKSLLDVEAYRFFIEQCLI